MPRALCRLESGSHFSGSCAWCSHEPYDQPDRDHDDGAEQEIAPCPAYRVKAHVPDRLDHPADAFDDITGIEAERRENDADKNTQQHQAEEHGKRRAAEKTA